MNWTNIRDKLPPVGKRVIVTDRKKIYQCYRNVFNGKSEYEFYLREKGDITSYERIRITHWILFPEEKNDLA